VPGESYVSNLRRAHQSAAPLAERLGLTPVQEADLREALVGEWEASPWRQRIEEGHPRIRSSRWRLSR
jgi:2,3-bisphosphoglycerate-dependent phosphoglycerate mutase